MDLYYAIKYAIDIKGNDILMDDNLINILNDFKAYVEVPASKYLIKSMLNEGVMAKLLMERQQSTDIKFLLSSYKNDLTEIYGFKIDLAEYVINSIAYALGWINETPSFNKNKVKSINDVSLNETLSEFFDDGQHLLFKQIPITGDIHKFINQLTNVGYSLIEPYSNVYHAATLLGSFAGNNNCTIAALGTPKSSIAYAVMIFFQEHHIWYTLKDQYMLIKNQLSKKYGAPQSYENFMDPYLEGDGMELTALWSDHCTYLSVFNVDNGKITVSMSKEAKVLISYQDQINNEIKEIELISIADDDF